MNQRYARQLHLWSGRDHTSDRTLQGAHGVGFDTRYPEEPTRSRQRLANLPPLFVTAQASVAYDAAILLALSWRNSESPLTRVS
jgi:hypothetical protein